MQLINPNSKIDFLGKRKIALGISAFMLFISLIALVPSIRGLNFGIDFTGGTMIELGYQEEADLNKIKATLEQGGHQDAVVQTFGTIHDVLIRLPIVEGKDMASLSNEVVATLQAAHSTAIDVRRA